MGYLFCFLWIKVFWSIIWEESLQNLPNKINRSYLLIALIASLPCVFFIFAFPEYGGDSRDYVLVAKKHLLNENFKILSSQIEEAVNQIKTKISWMNKKIYYEQL